ncbi:hypothetical protein [Flavobacterium silvaticum]|uniref:Uncharacterized protein n=1 Tax=Flavobacterium silvaticum TaxID=1852020 RepID=A0A972FS17_9FLAO|nr:hypothetical protein [Flavobacterium silvaticum]NMH28309.1 hypothetical protein [Flavobacterium silvaticum]
MKKSILLVCLICMSFATSSDPVERLGIKGPLQFNKTEFSLAWSQKPNEKMYVQEYLPKGETVDRFDQMLTLYVLHAGFSVEQAVAQKAEELTERKKTDEICHFSVIKSPDGKEQILDCLLSDNSSGKVDVVEL